MGSRERKRAERRKRKARRPDPAEARAELTEEYRQRSETRNRAAREALEPLPEGGRPPVVTLGAVVAAALAVFNLVAYASGLDLQGEDPSLFQVLAPALLMGVAAVGMWKARYWAVLGFQVILVFLLLGSSIALVQAANLWQAAAALGIIAVAGAFFWFMVKALARIQMPDRLPPE